MEVIERSQSFTVSRRDTSSGLNEAGMYGSQIILARHGSTCKKVRLRDLHPSLEGMQIQVLDKNSLSLSWEPVPQIIPLEQNSPMIRITTRCRRQVLLAQGHECLTVDDDGELIALRATELQPGRTLLPVASNVPGEFIKKWEPSQTEMNMVPPRKPRYQLDSLHLTNTIGWLFGRYIAAGSVDRNACVEFSNVHPKIVAKTAEIIKGLGLHSYLGIEKIKVGSVQLARALKSEFGSNSKDKRLPGWLFSAPRACRLGFPTVFGAVPA